MTAATLTVVGAQGQERSQPLASWLTPALGEAVRSEANRWIKSLRLIDYDGQSMRQRFRYQDESLWWFTELYLHKMRRLERAIATLLALEAAHESESPQRIRVTTGDETVRAAARAFATARHVHVEIEGAAASDHRQRLAGFLVGPTALLTRLRRRSVPGSVRHPRVAAFLHTAFWRGEATHARSGREAYIGPVLDALAARLDTHALAYVGLGPRRNFRTRRWWDPIVGGAHGPVILPIELLAPGRALSRSMALWRQREALASAVVTGPAVRAAAVWRNYDLWAVLSQALQDTARVQWPWSARSMDEARAALTHLRPQVAVTYAEAGGWGRALVLAARQLGIPSVGLQHGFIYRHWLNYEHEADEMERDGTEKGFPHPDKTCVFDRYAEQTLVERGHLPAEAVVVTGSPRLDELVSRAVASDAERLAVRAGLGVGTDERLVVVAAKHSEIRPSLAELVDAVTALPGLRCVIKPHPAESPDVYEASTRQAPTVTVASSDADLGRLLSASDGLITMNSTVAIDGLVLGVPALVVGLPNNLSPFVEAGVMIGAGPGGVRAGLEALLYDRETRARLRDQAAAFTADYRMRADGHAARRAADEVLAASQPPETIVAK